MVSPVIFAGLAWKVVANCLGPAAPTVPIVTLKVATFHSHALLRPATCSPPALPPPMAAGWPLGAAWLVLHFIDPAGVSPFWVESLVPQSAMPSLVRLAEFPSALPV